MLQKKYQYPTKTNEIEFQTHHFNGAEYYKINKYILNCLTKDNKYKIDDVFQSLSKWYIYNVNDTNNSYKFYFNYIGKEEYARLCLISWIYLNYNDFSFYNYSGAPSYEFTGIGKLSLVVIDGVLINLFEGFFSLFSAFKSIVNDFWFSFEHNKSEFIKTKNQYDKHRDYLYKLKIDKEREMLEKEIRNTIINEFEKIFKSEDDLINLYSQIRIFFNFSTDELLKRIGVYSKIHLDKTDYGQKYIEEILNNAERTLYQKVPRGWVIGFSYRQNKTYKYLLYRHGGAKGIENKIREMLKIEKKKKRQIATILGIDEILLSKIMKMYDIKLPYKEYPPEGNIPLKGKDEKIIEIIFHKNDMTHHLYYRFYYDKNNKRKQYECDWLITDYGNCIIELYKTQKDLERKDVKKKYEYYKTLQDYKLITFFEDDLNDEEYILQKIEQTMNVKIPRL